MPSDCPITPIPVSFRPTSPGKCLYGACPRRGFACRVRSTLSKTSVLFYGRYMMFGMSLFSRSKKSSQAPKTYRPWIDELESRVCPTSLSPSGIGAPPATLLPILTLNSQVQPGHVVLLTGNVTGDQNNAGITVTFGGAVTGSAMTDGDGNFSYTT